MQLVEDFTLEEFLFFHFKHKQSIISVQETIAYLGLQAATNKKLEYFSSGMKQRVKLAQAIMINTPIVLLDEPCSNLDENGIALFHKMIIDFANNKTIFVSSNDKQEYTFCERVINVQEYK